MLLKDMHSGGTVCSPTRASLLTGRNSWRDCVHGVYGPGDPTDGPSSNNGAPGDHNDTFAPQYTFTVADRAANSGGPGGPTGPLGTPSRTP